MALKVYYVKSWPLKQGDQFIHGHFAPDEFRPDRLEGGVHLRVALHHRRV